MTCLTKTIYNRLQWLVNSCRRNATGSFDETCSIPDRQGPFYNFRLVVGSFGHNFKRGTYLVHFNYHRRPGCQINFHLVLTLTACCRTSIKCMHLSLAQYTKSNSLSATESARLRLVMSINITQCNRLTLRLGHHDMELDSVTPSS